MYGFTNETVIPAKAGIQVLHKDFHIDRLLGFAALTPECRLM